MAQSYVETNEGAVNDGEDNELMSWLKTNKLLNVKQKFIDQDITIDDLKSLDIKNDLEYVILYTFYGRMKNLIY